MCKRSRFFLCLLCSFLCFVCSVSVPLAQQEQPFTIKIDTQLVVETVVVKDKDGHNIEGLTAKDFTVTEDNVPQTISVFQFQRLDDTPAPTPAPQAAPAPPVSAVQPAAPSSTTVKYQDRRLLVLFFDMMNILRRYRVRVNPTFTLVNIAIAVTEGIGKQLDPDVDLMAAALPFFAKFNFFAPEAVG